MNQAEAGGTEPSLLGASEIVEIFLDSVFASVPHNHREQLIPAISKAFEVSVGEARRALNQWIAEGRVEMFNIGRAKRLKRPPVASAEAPKRQLSPGVLISHVLILTEDLMRENGGEAGRIRKIHTLLDDYVESSSELVERYPDHAKSIGLFTQTIVDALRPPLPDLEEDFSAAMAKSAALFLPKRSSNADVLARIVLGESNGIGNIEGFLINNFPRDVPFETVHMWNLLFQNVALERNLADINVADLGFARPASIFTPR